MVLFGRGEKRRGGKELHLQHCKQHHDNTNIGYNINSTFCQIIKINKYVLVYLSHAIALITFYWDALDDLIDSNIPDDLGTYGKEYGREYVYY